MNKHGMNKLHSVSLGQTYRNILIVCLLLLCCAPALGQESSTSDASFECLTNEDAFLQHIEQGAFYRGRRDYNRAYQEYNCVIEIDPFSPLGYRGRAIALIEQGNYQTALADLEIALNIMPDDALLYNSQGWAYFGLGDTEAALTSLNRAIALDPNYALAFNNRGLVERSVGDLEAALRDFQVAIDLGYPDRRYVPYINMGDTYAEELNDLHSAAQWYETATYITPSVSFIHEKLGDVYAELGMWSKSAYHYEQFIYLEDLDRPQVLYYVRVAAMREFLLLYAPTLLIVAILAYFFLAPRYRRWRQQRLKAPSAIPPSA